MDHSIKYRINIISCNKAITAHEDDLLADKIQETGINLCVYCNKKGLCGKCFVEIVKGKLPPLNEREAFFIEQKGLAKNHRLACLYKIKGDIEIKIPEEFVIQETFILQTGIKSLILINPPVKKYYLKLKKPEIGFPYSLLDLLEKYFRKKKLIIHLDLLKKMPDLLEHSKFFITTTLYNDREILSIEPNDTLSKNFGIAIDVGTTTVVVELLDLNTGKSIDIQTSPNNQIKYGSDVISRISFAFLDLKNLAKLKNSILNTLNEMIRQILERNKIDHSFVYEIVLAGNTSMNHFLLGIPVKTLAVAPFHSVFTRLSELSSHDLGFKISKYGKVYIVPNIKSFVGGDISAGLIAADVGKRKGNYLFIDLGTNGEIVLKTKEKFITTSTAAGPAFEGMNISCGMLALPGAIYKAEYKQRLVLHTIKNKPAIGICGTGLIDLLSVFLDKGIITAKGKIKNKTKKIQITDHIYINQKDVREMQLAIAAIASGIRMVLLKNNLKLEQLDGIFIAGAFGNYLNIKNSKKIGLLPQISEDKIIFIGNASLAGAKVLLLSKPARKKIESLVKKIQYFSLATNPLFQKYFIEALEFKNLEIKKYD